VITGFRHLDLQRQLPRLSSGQISRQLKRLRVHGLIKRIGRRYKYYVTELGRRAVITGLKLRELFVLPKLGSAPGAGWPGDVTALGLPQTRTCGFSASGSSGHGFATAA
jgi:hypothetical protein